MDLSVLHFYGYIGYINGYLTQNLGGPKINQKSWKYIYIYIYISIYIYIYKLLKIKLEV